MKTKTELIITTKIEQKIFLIREQKVMLDRDLAELYNVPTHRLNEQVKRNMKRFPADFMFKLTRREKQEVIANCDILQKLKFSHSLPYAFTEQGVAMLSSVLNSERAITVNIHIMRTFTKLRKLMLEHKDLHQRITALERKYNRKFRAIFEAIRQLLEPPAPPSKPKLPIGFYVEPKEEPQPVNKRRQKNIANIKL